MADDLATSYGRAITAIGEAEGVTDRLSDELFSFASAVDANGELREKLTDPSVPLDARQAAAADLLQRAHPATQAAVQMLLASGRMRNIREIADATVQQSAEARGAAVATVRTAKPLADGQRDALARALSARAGQPVELKVVVDPSLVGGLLVQMGGSVIDGSVAKRLTDLRSSLASV